MLKKPLPLEHRDMAVKPGDDFYEYAVGKWCKETALPPEYSRWGSFEELQEYNLEQLREICEHPEFFAPTPLAELAQKVSTLYRLGMDEERINKEGYSVLREQLEKIEAIKTNVDLVKIVAALHCAVASPLFSFAATPDAKNSSWMIAGFYQGGLGLPDRDYYLGSDERFAAIRREYEAHLVRLHRLFGLEEALAKEAAVKIIRLEHALAEVSTPREELRDPHKNYHKISVAELQRLAPSFDWSLFLGEVGLPAVEQIDVGQLAFFEGVGKLCASVPIEEWKLYVRSHLFLSLARYLGAPFEEELFNFEGRILSGQKQMKPRWKRVLKQVGGLMGMALGQLFVYKHFPEQAKMRAEELVGHLMTTFGERINRLEWMSETTKEQGLKKLRAIHPKIGYPEKWIDYATLIIDSSCSYVENAMRCMAFHMKREIKKIDKPVDKEEWFVSPHVINAFYDPLKNEIVFPAAILQPPFFFAEADDAVNYGGIGGIIGHELTHGFDDEGRKFDQDGNMHDWWTHEDEEKFKTRAEKLVEQFDGYVPIDNIHVNGRFTLGENIADLGGIAIAFEALQKTLKKNNPGLIDGLTPEQRFFLSWAEGWRQVIADELARLYLTIDPHAPGKYRVNGPMSNAEAFYVAFKVEEGQALYRSPEQRVVIW